ncbi:MAG: DUF4238 domain-containing protein [Candidatus Thorarchaeota archaeon]
MERENKTKNCHYVQRAYLKNFGCYSKNTHIYVFDKWLNEVYIEPKKIKEVAVEDFFYPQWLEEWLNQNIESYGIEAIRNLIINKDVNNLSEAEQRRLINWINLQFIRTPEFQKMLFSAINQLFKLVENREIPSIQTEFIEEFIKNERNIANLPHYEDQIKRLLWNFIQDVFMFNQELLNTHQFSIIENKTEFNYYTSDNPVVIAKQSGNYIPFEIQISWIGNQKFINISDSLKLWIDPQTNFFLPLTPDVLLVIWNKKQKVPEFSIQKSLQHVYKINTLITTQSTRYIFSQSKEFQLAFKAIEEFPGSRKKGINRVRPKYLHINHERIK